MSMINFVITADSYNLCVDKTSVFSICEFMWDGFSIEDLIVLSPKTNRNSILLGCLFATKKSLTWRLRWGKWANDYRDDILNGMSDYVPDPPSKVTTVEIFKPWLADLKRTLFL